MKIGVDIDGVILDSERGFRFYSDYYSYFTLGKERVRSDTTTPEINFPWTEDETKFYYTNFYDAITRESNLMVGAKEILQKLKSEGHKLYIVTQRGSHTQTAITEAIEKLKLLDVEFDDIFWGCRNKFAACEEAGIDVMIDDSPYHAKPFMDKQINFLYFKEPKIEKLEAKNIFEVDSWMDIYHKIKQLDNLNCK
jgi:uncharacterized HAD superfamily protein